LEEEDKIQHEAFYNAVEESTKKLGKNSRTMTKEQYNEIIEALSTVPMILSRTTKRAAAVTAVLFELFCFIGPSAILQSDNGREFSNQASDSKQMSLDDDIRDRCVSSKCLCS
jgi:DNA-binding MurR/RpiR family transcriptional regulator